jgi:hypothetical protein
MSLVFGLGIGLPNGFFFLADFVLSWHDMVFFDTRWRVCHMCADELSSWFMMHPSSSTDPELLSN